MHRICLRARFFELTATDRALYTHQTLMSRDRPLFQAVGTRPEIDNGRTSQGHLLDSFLESKHSFAEGADTDTSCTIGSRSSDAQLVPGWVSIAQNHGFQPKHDEARCLILTLTTPNLSHNQGFMHPLAGCGVRSLPEPGNDLILTLNRHPRTSPHYRRYPFLTSWLFPPSFDRTPLVHRRFRSFCPVEERYGVPLSRKSSLTLIWAASFLIWMPQPSII